MTRTVTSGGRRARLLGGLSAAWIQEFEGSILYDARNFGDLLYPRSRVSQQRVVGLRTPDFAAGDSALSSGDSESRISATALRVSGENRATQLDEAGEATRYGLVNKLGWADFERTIGRSRLPTDGTLGTAALGNIDLPRLEQIIDQAATSWSESATSSIAKILVAPRSQV